MTDDTGNEQSGTTASRILRAMLRQRCPRCLEGPVFQGVWAMRARCTLCGHQFERAPGFFVGAMYFSYAMAVPIFALLAILVHGFLPRWSVARVMSLVLIAFAPMIPVVFRWSRIVWMHLMLKIDPEA